MYGNENRNSIFRYILLLALIGGAVFYFRSNVGTRNSMGGLHEPTQTEAEGETRFTLDGYDMRIKYLYEYNAIALVVHTKDYMGVSLGDKLSPKDIALAWGSVAAYNKVIDFHWSQSGRWVHWRTDSYSELAPIGDSADVDRQSSNNHLIPADSAVKKDIKKIRTGDIINLKGYLVNVRGLRDDGAHFTWNSSTTRDDSGDGACEVIYVTSVEWLN